MYEWLSQNRKWVFSGVGLAIAGAVIAVIRWLFRRRSAIEELARAELQKRRRDSLPLFHWRDGSTDHVKRVCNFQNLGGTVSSLTIQTSAPVNISIAPSDRLQANILGVVRFAARSGRITYPLEFEIRYRTSYQEDLTERFRVLACDRQPTKIGK